MERIPKEIYTAEFREQAVGLIENEGLTLAEAARRLSMLKATLKNWVSAKAAGKLKNLGKN